MENEALANFAKHGDALFSTIRTGTMNDVLALGCPVCGGPLVVCWMRQLIPFWGSDVLNVRCSAARCAFTIQADGKIPRPPWAKRFSGTLTTTPGTLAQPRLSRRE